MGCYEVLGYCSNVGTDAVIASAAVLVLCWLQSPAVLYRCSQCHLKSFHLSSSSVTLYIYHELNTLYSKQIYCIHKMLVAKNTRDTQV